MIPWTQAYIPYVKLDQTDKVTPIYRNLTLIENDPTLQTIISKEEEKLYKKKINMQHENLHGKSWDEKGKEEVVQNWQTEEQDQKFDVLLEFRCPDIWLVRMSKQITKYHQWEIPNRVVDGQECKPLTTNTTYIDYLKKSCQLPGQANCEQEYKNKEIKWTRL